MLITRSNCRLLRRYRFGASPATGLVGMQENAFVSDFFTCLRFFPLASE
ncbi:unnamed protein product, partial [Sphacelaria rigidula]